VKAQPVLEYIRPYTPELTGWFHDFGQGTANYDANGHFARIQPIFNAFQFTNTRPAALSRTAAALQRARGYQTRQRCPGAASQPTPTARRRSPTTATSAPTTATRARCPGP
jgi:phospholipid/cholesterol/gamma-HCH transport system substrate-binding protein